MQKRTHILGEPIWGAPCLALAVMLTLSAFASAQEPSEPLATLRSSAESARTVGDLPRAIDLYQRAVELDPKWSDGWWYLGSMQYGANAFGPAAVALTHYVDLMPNAGPAFALRGLCEFEQGEYPESLQDLQRGVALGAANQPRNAGIILYHEAILLTKTESFEQALGTFTEMVKHGDVNPDVLAGIGLAGLRLPMFAKDLDPSQRGPVSAAGDAAATFMAGDRTAADHAFQSLFKNDPTLANIHFFYGYLLFSVDSDQAIEQFKRELAVSPKNAVTYSMLAWAYGLRGDYAASLPYAQKAADEEPTLLIAQLALGRSLAETGDLRSGLEHLLIVVAADPDNLDAHLALAKAYSRLGRKEDARRERLQCLAISGHGAEQGVASNATL
jgi:tetratricopeptide (TPR) repeat protein